MKETLCIRADATPQIGTGHVMRCIALAQAWQVQGGVVHLIGRVTPALQTRLAHEDIIYHTLDAESGSKEDVRKTNAKARQHNAQWIVVDGYKFGADYQEQLKGHGLKVLFIDDYGHANYYYADLVLNQNIDAKEALYSKRSEDTKLLLGPHYALLRKEFWPWRSHRRTPRDEVNNILVTLGGSDPDNVMAQVLSALQFLRKDSVQVTAIVGGSSPHYDQLAVMAEQSSVPIHLLHDVGNMAELMSDMDLAISAGGSTCWELAFMGIPNAIIVLADNQRSIANKLDAEGISLNLGWSEDVSIPNIVEAVRSLLKEHEKRKEMARKGQSLVDGKGSERVLSIISKPKELALRLAEESDSRMLWNWANDEVTRANSYNSDPIPWSQHQKWFREKLRDPKSTIYIARLSEQDVGQVRFDEQEERATISVVVAPDVRGMGIGTELIKKGTCRFLRGSSLDRVDAHIKSGNIASIHAFENAGYRERSEEVIKGKRSVIYSFARNDD